MKLCIGSTPVSSLHIRKLDIDTNDADIVPSDMNAGSTAYARGQKITGTGKCFSFATYGTFSSNGSIPIPVTSINTVVLCSDVYFVKMSTTMLNFKEYDFSVDNEIATITVNGTNYPISMKIDNGNLVLTCSENVSIEAFFGKDDH